jgi:threonine aldolase
MRFSSDNAEGWAPEILDALARAGDGAMPAYGNDALTGEVARRFNDLFERDVAVFLVSTGTAANGLALASVCPPYGAIFAHAAAHLQVDECAAPEFFTGGAKLIPLPGSNGKLAPETLTEALAHFYDGFVHHAQPSVLSLTQATESGTVYTRPEIEALASVARARRLSVHMDGARFANALVHLGCSPAEATWKAGVDLMSFGATKNGCLAVEAVVFFDPERAASFEYLRKRSGHLLSKHRVLSAQMLAYLDGDLWLRLAGQANRMAARLGAALSGIHGVRLWYPVEANEVFVSFPGEVAWRLMEQGASFHPWQVPGDPAGGRMCRLVTSFNTRAADIDRFVDLVRQLCGP